MNEHALQHRVLIVDDDATICLLMSESLKQSGLHVKQASSGRVALQLFQTWHPSIIVSDVKMPEMDGFSLCAQIRQMEAGKTVPIIMATGLEDVESINKAYDLGATDFITKPINYTILEHRIKYILRAHKNTQVLAENQERLAWAQNVAQMGYWELDTDQQEITLSSEVFDMLNVSTAAFDHKIDTCLAMIHPDDRAEVWTNLKQTIEADTPCNITHRVVLETGGERVVNLQARRKFTQDNIKTHKIRGLVQDVTAQKQAKDQILFLKMYDPLTGLPNKQLFVEYASKALSLARRQQSLLGLLCIDIDQFRRINETHGPGAGDIVLKEVVKRFLEMLRVSDSVCGQDAECATLARNSGNTFNILLTNVTNIQAFVVVANRIHARFLNPFIVDGDDIMLTASVGISAFPMDGDNVNMLLKNAETAMYHARKECFGSYKFYSPAMNAASMQRFQIESRLRSAIENGDLEMHYQPQFELVGQRLVGMEALLRWNDDKLGRVSPGAFIPLAEETGLIIPLTEFVLSKSCVQTQQWIDQLGVELRIGVNISSYSLQDKNFPGFVSKVFHASGLQPKNLEMEITEGSIMHDVEDTIVLLNKLRQLGLTLSIDDFGTGYSSFSYLHKFPVSTLKIDQSFIMGMDEGSGNKKIVNAIVNLAHSLQLNVIAEGVETLEQMHYLSQCGCDEVQGFFLSRPLPAADFEVLARNSLLV